MKHTNSSQIRVKISWFRSRMTIKVTVFNMYTITQSILKMPIGLKDCLRINYSYEFNIYYLLIYWGKLLIGK